MGSLQIFFPFEIHANTVIYLQGCGLGGLSFLLLPYWSLHLAQRNILLFVVCHIGGGERLSIILQKLEHSRNNRSIICMNLPLEDKDFCPHFSLELVLGKKIFLNS